jgi:hypothetical protein
MALTKVNYVDGVTTIMAKNLNDIQNEVIANGTAITNQAEQISGKASASALTAEATARAETDTALSNEVDDLKSALMPMFSSTIDVEQGYWAIASGTPSSSTTWCRTKYNVPKNVVISVTDITMLLLAYDGKTGNYIGTWDDTTFATTFVPAKQLKRELNLSVLSANYPNYVFKIDFYNADALLSVDTVLSHCTISTDVDLKQNKICNNLIGNTFGYLYPVELQAGQYLTIKTSDGQPNNRYTTISFYDEQKQYITYYGFGGDWTQRVIGPLSAETASAKYIALTNDAPRVPLMINHGLQALDYEKYFMPSTTLTDVVTSISKDILDIHEEDHELVYAIKRHYNGGNGDVDNTFKALLVSDIHKEIARTNRMVKLINAWGSSYFDVAINTGDTTQYLYDEDVSWYDDARDNSIVPILTTIGNHDAYTNLSGTLVNKVDVYNKFIAPLAAKTSIVQPTNAATNGLNYYYKDVGGVRVIVLDCMYWDANELTWFESVLADAATNEIPVIACSHAPFGETYCQLLDSPWNVGWFHRDTTLTPITAAEAVQTFVGNGGTFICWLMGHIHGDEIETLPNYGGQLAICTNTFCDRGTTVVKNTDDTAYNYDTLSYITVDTVNTSIKLYRIGANVDTAGHKRNGFVWNYTTKSVVTEW